MQTDESVSPAGESPISAHHLESLRRCARALAAQGQLVDELVQEGSLVLVEKSREYPHEEGLWFRAAEWRMRDILRRERRLSRRVSALQEVVAQDIRPDQQIREAQVREHLRKAVHTLPSTERKVVEIFLAGSSQAQIAQQLGYSRPRVSKVVRRAVEFMRPDVMVAQAA